MCVLFIVLLIIWVNLLYLLFRDGRLSQGLLNKVEIRFLKSIKIIERI